MKQKVLLSVNYMKDIGGIGTAAINLLNEIHDLYDVTLCIPCCYISKKYIIPDNVKIINGSNYLRDVIVDRKDLSEQNIMQKLIRNVRRILNHYILKTKGIEYALSKIQVPGEYDAAVAFTDYRYDYPECKCFDYNLVLKNVNAKRKIAWIHNDPIRLGWTENTAIKRLFSFDAIVNVSYDCKSVFDVIIPSFKQKSYVVYNTYNIQKIKSRAEEVPNVYENSGKLHFVTVARIQTEQKRIDRIIEVCKMLNEEGFTNFDWTLVGSGSELQKFQKQVESLGLSNIVIFAGLQTNPYPYMKQADAFILVSEYEGYGMTIKEAQILGTPTFVTNFGPAHEAVEDGMQGEICDNNTKGVYKMVKRLLQDPNRIEVYNDYLSKNPVTNAIAIEQFNRVCSVM